MPTSLTPELMDSPQRILFITTLLRLPGESPYMTNELVDVWRARGHEVDVIVLRWDASEQHRAQQVVQANGVRIYHQTPNKLFRRTNIGSRLGKWGLSSLEAAWHMKSMARRQRFDLVVVMAPCTAIAGLAWLFTRGSAAKSYLYITDFFPYAQRDLGLIPDGLLFRIARRIENTLIRRFDAIGCMSPRNVDYLRSRYRLRDSQRAYVSPIWGPSDQVDRTDHESTRRRYDLPIGVRLLLFGGQLVEGRGIDDVLAAAKLAHESGRNLCFVVIGAGRLRPMVEAFARTSAASLRLLDPLPRTEYLKLASACDLGIVATVAHTDVPTFPSRTIDYLRARLPVVASVEESTDFGDFVESQKIGVSVRAGNGNRLLEACERLLADTESMVLYELNCEHVLNAVFDVRLAATRILNQAHGIGAFSASSPESELFSISNPIRRQSAAAAAVDVARS